MWPFRPKGTQPGAPTTPAPGAVENWASQPPIEGVVGQIQRTIDPESFQRDLAVHQPPHPFLGPLGHAVSVEAPGGTVAGLITTAVHPASAASELTHRTNAKAPRSVQRRSGSGVTEDRPPVEEPSLKPVGSSPSSDVAPPAQAADPSSAILSAAGGIEVPRLHLAATPEPPSSVQEEPPANESEPERLPAEPAPLIGGSSEPAIQRMAAPGAPTATSPSTTPIAQPGSTPPANRDELPLQTATARPPNSFAEPLKSPEPSGTTEADFEEVSAREVLPHAAPEGRSTPDHDSLGLGPAASAGDQAAPPPPLVQRLAAGTTWSDSTRAGDPRPVTAPPDGGLPAPTLGKGPGAIRKPGLGPPLRAVPLPGPPQRPEPGSDAPLQRAIHVTEAPIELGVSADPPSPREANPSRQLSNQATHDGILPDEVSPAPNGPLLAQRTVTSHLYGPSATDRLPPANEDHGSLQQQPTLPVGPPSTSGAPGSPTNARAHPAQGVPPQEAESRQERFFTLVEAPSSGQAAGSPTPEPTPPAAPPETAPAATAPLLAQRHMAGTAGGDLPLPGNARGRPSVQPQAGEAFSPQPGPRDSAASQDADFPLPQHRGEAIPTLSETLQRLSEPDLVAPIISARPVSPQAVDPSQNPASHRMPETNAEAFSPRPQLQRSQGPLPTDTSPPELRKTENLSRRPLLGAFDSIPISRLAAEGDAAKHLSWAEPGMGPATEGSFRTSEERPGGWEATSRSLGPTRPVLDDALPVSRFVHPADVALSAGIAHRAHDGSIVFYSPVGEAPEPPMPSEPSPAPPAPVQRVEEPPSTPTVTASAAPTAAAPGGGAGGGDLDDLARKLYPKIRPYLKKELWLDRERAGMLTSSGR
jgi:hypothetical protein